MACDGGEVGSPVKAFCRMDCSSSANPAGPTTPARSGRQNPAAGPAGFRGKKAPTPAFRPETPPGTQSSALRCGPQNHHRRASCPTNSASCVRPIPHPGDMGTDLGGLRGAVGRSLGALKACCSEGPGRRIAGSSPTKTALRAFRPAMTAKPPPRRIFPPVSIHPGSIRPWRPGGPWSKQWARRKARLSPRA